MPKIRGRAAGVKVRQVLGALFTKEERLQRYIFKILKTCDADYDLNNEATTTTINSIMLDLYSNVSKEAAELSRRRCKSVLGAQDVQTTVKLRLPGEICKYALSEAAKALVKYRSSIAK